MIGADQVLELDDGTMLSKPGSRAEALAQLRLLSGQTHYLHSAAVIVERGERVWGETESVAMDVRPLGEDFLEAYLDAEYEAVRFNVGGYRIEGLGAQLFEEIEGSHFAVLGLPLLPLLAYLRERGLLRKLMGVPYAEVIGDPIAHSKSPVIHKFWLEKLGIDGDYRATRVAAGRAGRLFRRAPGRSGLARLQRHHSAQAGGDAAARRTDRSLEAIGAVNAVTRVGADEPADRAQYRCARRFSTR